MPELHGKGVKAWWRLLKRSPAVLSKKDRAKWVGSLPGAWRLQGCIKYQVLAPSGRPDCLTDL